MPDPLLPPRRLPLRSLPPEQRPPLDAAARGVLAETALFNRQRFAWRLLLPLLHSLVESVLADFSPPDDEVRLRAVALSERGMQQ